MFSIGDAANSVPKSTLIFFFWLEMSYISFANANDSLIVNISSGAIRGIRVNNPDADAFLGIPFAKPPVGRLRFRRPEPAEPWEGILNATRFPNACFQNIDPSNFSGDSMWNPRTNLSEDCLYLNVWAPIPRPYRAPVMVWIHGGGFTVGSTSRDMFNGKYLAAEEKVIVVTLAYRLGVFGFFYLGHESAPGNQGLFDQVMGLQWVQDNIEKFGGDPNRVTLFGCSAGGISIKLHLMSPLSHDLFHRAIIQSGVIGLQESNSTEAKRRGLLYAFDSLGCPRSDNPENISNCLRYKPPDLLIRNQLHLLRGIFIPYPDGTFLTRSTNEIMTEGLFKKCPILTGTVKNEGTYFVYYSAPEYLNLTYRTMTRDQFVVIMNRMFTSYTSNSTLTKPAVREKLIALYANKENPDDTDENLAALDSAFTDAYFVCPTNDFARAYSSYGQDVYLYQLTQRYRKNPWPEWMGVVHGDEMYFVFGSAPAPGLDLTDEEKTLSKAMMTYWANFARTGNPNAPASNKTIGIWPKYNETSGWSHLELNLRYFNRRGNLNSTKSGLRIKQCAALHQILSETDEAEKVSAASQSMIPLATIFFQFLLLTSLTLSSTPV